MLCDNCKDRDSVVKLVQIVEGSPKELHLCEKCAAKRASRPLPPTPAPQLAELLQKLQQQPLIGGGSGGGTGPANADAVRCTFCRRLSPTSERRDGWAAHTATAPSRAASGTLLRRVHGSARHTGRRYEPPQPDAMQRAVTLGELRDRLQRAIDSEAVRAGRGHPRPDPGAGMSLDLALLPDGGVSWLDASGEHADIVLSTRIRLARNVEGYAFTGRARDGERLRVLARCATRLREVASLAHSVLLRVDELPSTDRLLLHERHLVSKELAGLDAQHPVRSGAAVFLGPDVGVMVNEEDHLRLQALRSGFGLPAAFAAVQPAGPGTGLRVPYAFHDEFGFLTACPTNVGTGMRASVLIHLPGLVLTKEMSKVLASLQQMGLTYRGLYGEGSDVVGNFFQISNQTTLGKSEDELLDQLVRVVKTVIEREEDARRLLLRDAGYIIEDKLWRAYGTLRYARSLTFDEAMNYLSGVRLAVGLKLISGLSVYTLNKLLIFQPVGAPFARRRAGADGERGERGTCAVRAADARQRSYDARLMGRMGAAPESVERIV